MEPTRPAYSAARRWRISLPVWLGVVLLLASIGGAAVSMRSHAGDSASYSAAATTPADDQPWMTLGSVDIKGGVTKLYPLQPGRVKSVEAVENEPVEANAPLFHLDDTLAVLKLQQAKIALDAAKEQLTIAEAKIEPFEQQIGAQKEAVNVAGDNVKRAKNKRDTEKDLLQKGAGGSAESVKDAEIQVRQAEASVRAEQKKLAALEAGRPQLEGAIKLRHMDIDAKEAQLKEAQKGVDECVVRAPSAGIPLRILVKVGETLGPNPHEPAIQFAPNRPLLVRAEVEQEFVGRVRKDQSVIIQDHVTGQECARGKVTTIARWYAHRRSASPEMLQLNNEARTLECIITIDSTSQELRLGQRVRVQFPQ
jgi:multidrug resistance efflux pump